VQGIEPRSGERLSSNGGFFLLIACSPGGNDAHPTLTNGGEGRPQPVADAANHLQPRLVEAIRSWSLLT